MIAKRLTMLGRQGIEIQPSLSVEPKDPRLSLSLPSRPSFFSTLLPSSRVDAPFIFAAVVTDSVYRRRGDEALQNE